MIDIQQKLIERCANVRTIDTLQKFLREMKGKPTIEPWQSGVGVGEVHTYENGQIEVGVRNSGVITLSLYSPDLGFDYYFVEC